MVIKQLSTAKESHIPRELPPDLQIANKTAISMGYEMIVGLFL